MLTSFLTAIKPLFTSIAVIAVAQSSLAAPFSASTGKAAVSRTARRNKPFQVRSRVARFYRHAGRRRYLETGAQTFNQQVSQNTEYADKHERWVSKATRDSQKHNRRTSHNRSRSNVGRRHLFRNPASNKSHLRWRSLAGEGTNSRRLTPRSRGIRGEDLRVRRPRSFTY